MDFVETVINRSSRYLKVRRVVAWMLRFINNIRRAMSNIDPLKCEFIVEEESQAETIILKTYSGREGISRSAEVKT